MKKLLLVFFVSVFLAFPLKSNADTVTVTDTITFDGGAGDPDTVTTFSQSVGTPPMMAMISFDQNSPNGNNGTQGIEFIQTQNGVEFAFSGGIIGGLDLGINPLITPGAITESNLELFTFSIDSQLVSGPQITGGNGPIRIEPLNGGFNERIDLPFTITQGSTFQSFSFDLANASVAQRTALVNQLNANGSTEIQFVFDFSTTDSSTVRFDNLQISTLVSVPEPSSVCGLLLLCGAACMRRRRTS